jgi:hypothetical protein
MKTYLYACAFVALLIVTLALVELDRSINQIERSIDTLIYEIERNRAITDSTVAAGRLRALALADSVGSLR